MNLLSLLNYGKKTLADAGCENASFDAFCMLEHLTGLSKTEIFKASSTELQYESENLYKKFIQRRTEGEPLQYILGKWEFMGHEFYVGPGVLIPRSETEGLVELAVEEIEKKKNAVVFDLCAGSGCIGLSIANACKNAEVFLIEKSETAFEYLSKNLLERESICATAVLGDIFTGFLSFNLPCPDIIVSNPPYIPSGELAGLQKEVQFEPRIALDGGSDGLDFYRAVFDLWLPYLNCCGIAALECGENQDGDISKLISHKYKNFKFKLDINKIKRILVIKQ